MKAFQLDECFNGRSFAAGCNSNGLCRVLRMPKSLLGTKDPKLLPTIMTRGAPLLTVDRCMVEEHIDHIPTPHAGFIVVKTADTTRPLKQDKAIAIIEKFKALYPEWNTTDWSDKCLEIDENVSALSVVKTSAITPIVALRLDNPDFLTEMFKNIQAADEMLGKHPQSKIEGVVNPAETPKE
jgi:hypothetical protein